MYPTITPFKSGLLEVEDGNHLSMNIEKSDLQKIVIIGNSGSGKSYLAVKLSEILGPAVIHLDQLFWEPGGFGKKRPAEIVHGEVQQLSQAKAWIVEGVFGDLASMALENATALIFLNKCWTECETSLIERGSESSKQLDLVEAEKNFQDLLLWGKAYYERENSRSLIGHIKIFNDFQKTKYEFKNRQECESWLKQIPADL